MKQIVSNLFILGEIMNINYIFREIFKKFTMNSTNANIINSICLIVIGLWGYFEVSSPTALIPVGFGAVLILCTSGVKNQNKVVAHIAVLLTFIILVALAGMRLPKSIEKGGLGLVRVLLMIGTSLLSMGYFVSSFIAARKARKNS